jgi:methionyl-tRNA synthetase
MGEVVEEPGERQIIQFMGKDNVPFHTVRYFWQLAVQPNARRHIPMLYVQVHEHSDSVVTSIFYFSQGLTLCI